MRGTKWSIIGVMVLPMRRSGLRGFLGAVLVGCALPGVALAGAESGSVIVPAAPAPPPPAQAAAPPPAGAPPVVSPPQPYAPPPQPYAPPPQPYAPPSWMVSPYERAPLGYPLPAYLVGPRLAVLDAQIADLQLRHHDISLVWPTILTIAGPALFAMGLVVVSGSICDKDLYGQKVNPSCVESSDGQTAGGLMLIAGIAGTTAGIVSLIVRSARRRHIARQIYDRQLEASALRGTPPPVRLNVAPTPRGGGVASLAFTF